MAQIGKRLGHTNQWIAIPIVFQYSENPFNRIVFAVIGRVAGQLNIHLMMCRKFYPALEPLSALAFVFRTVVGIDYEGMRRMTVFLSVGQICESRSTMKSAVALPVVKHNHVSAVSGR